MHALRAQSRVFTPRPRMPCKCGPTKAKHTQSTLGSPGPFGTAEGRKNMTTTPETSLEVNAGLLRACDACTMPSFYTLAPIAQPSVLCNQGKTHAMHSWFSRPIWYCRVPRNHDNDTGDVASGHQWPISCTHRVYQANLLLKPRHNIRNPHVALQQGPFGS